MINHFADSPKNWSYDQNLIPHHFIFLIHRLFNVRPPSLFIDEPARAFGKPQARQYMPMDDVVLLSTIDAEPEMTALSTQ